ncbi:MAG: glycosyltransferase, partial [Bacteroidia bacterium]
GFQADDFVVLYSGSIGEKQGLDALIDIAIECQGISNLKFLICGTGPYKQNLQTQCEEKGASNVSFLPLQEMNVFNEFLNMADLHLVLQKAEAADLVMPSKLTTILAAGGLVLVTAFKGTSLHDVIHSHEMGIIIPPEDNKALKEAIVEAVSNEYVNERKNAREYAEKYLDQEAILSAMESKLLK